MNKELIERLANKAAAETDLLNPKIDPQDRDWELCTRFLAAVDAERGKEAVAEVGEFSIYEKHPGQPLPVGTKLFLAPQPAIPEGMALVPIDIHPLDGTERNGVATLLCNPPEVLRDQDPTDYYAYWWGLLCAAAGVAP